MVLWKKCRHPNNMIRWSSDFETTWHIPPSEWNNILCLSRAAPVCFVQAHLLTCAQLLQVWRHTVPVSTCEGLLVWRQAGVTSLMKKVSLAWHHAIILKTFLRDLECSTFHNGDWRLGTCIGKYLGAWDWGIWYDEPCCSRNGSAYAVNLPILRNKWMVPFW